MLLNQSIITKRKERVLLTLRSFLMKVDQIKFKSLLNINELHTIVVEKYNKKFYLITM